MSSNSPDPISIQVASGFYQFKIKNSKTKDLKICDFIITPEFYVGGGNWLIRYYPQGSGGVDNKDTYIGICLELLNVFESVTVDYELGVLNKYGRPTAESWIMSTETFHNKKSSVYRSFMKRSDLESDYIKDDYFIIVCSITEIIEPCAMLKRFSIGAFPNNLAEELRALLERQEETDVTFELEGENISAHRLILASRSPVFRAELFGPMVEKDRKCIKIDNIEPLVFRGMLHFMYTDSLPDMEDLVNGETSGINMSSTILHQQLLVAANRYALEGLKTLCEERLSSTISINTVLSLLAVALQHNWDYLKEECLEFIAEPKNFKKVVLTKEYISLVLTCPSLLDELRRVLFAAHQI